MLLLKNNLGKALDLVVAYLSLENCRACKMPVNNRHAGNPPQSICAQCWLRLLKESQVVETIFTLKAGTVPVQAAGDHSSLLRKLIIKLKQNEDPLLARDLSYLMVKNTHQLRRQIPGKRAQFAQPIQLMQSVPLIIAPVPLHKKRLHDRGFNQSELLARALSCWLDFPVSTQVLKRTRDTRSQRGLHKDQRWVNMQGAFKACGSLAQGKSILLIDDVHTSGATMQAAAQALFDAGAVYVTGMSVAAAPLLYGRRVAQ